MLVSVYIPTKNRLELLKRAIQSVKEQTYKNIEIIVVDDGSTDGTREYLTQEMELGSLKAIFHEKSLGACAARNAAIMSAQGEFVTGLDDDDYFLPSRISEFITVWVRREINTVALCSNALFKIDDKKTIITKRKAIIIKNDLIMRNHIGNQIFTRTETIINIGGFDPVMPAWQDFDCWLRILNVGNDQIECLRSASYVVDTSHPHERISKGIAGERRVSLAMSMLLKKNKFSKSEKRLITSHYYVYFPNQLKLIPAINIVISSRSFFYSFHIFRLYASGLRRRLGF